MKKLIVILSILLISTSCKKKKETILTNTDGSAYKESPTGVNSDEKTTASYQNDKKKSSNTDEKSMDGKAAKIPVIDKDLTPFNNSEVLKFLKLEEIQLGMKESDFKEINIKANQNLESKTVRNGEGNFPVYHISIGGVPVLEIYIENDIVSEISLLNKNSTPAKMLGIGNSFAELLSVYPTARALGSEMESRVTVTIDGYVFVLDALHGVSESYDAPLQSKIKKISVR